MINQNPADGTAELTRTYTAAQLEAIGVPYEDGVIHEQETSESHRWYTVRRIVFRDPADGTTWLVLRADPATEMQENDWWIRYASADQIVCKRAVSREVTVTKWFDATADDLAESEAGR